MAKTIVIDDVEYELKPLVKKVSREWPIDGDAYWFVDLNDGVVTNSSVFEEMHGWDMSLLKIGNCFKSKETADKVADLLHLVLEGINSNSGSAWFDIKLSIQEARGAVQADKESV